MAVKKSELYASLWKLCDELRGGMDASQYKDYVLALLFMKYVSDKAATRRDYLLDVPEGARFSDMVAAKNQKDIGDRINKIIARLALANPSLRGAIDVANFNDPDKLGKGQEMVDRLTKLIGIFQNPALDFGANTAEGDDLLGDAYEYLMRNFATEAGKSKGQFYTPAEVSRIMAEVVGASRATSNQQSIYDPTCGSGSLLLKAHAAAKSATGFDLAIYGQEMDNATAALARMNMVLHDAETAEIHQDNTLAAPFWTEGPRELKRFDFVVANPPFSTKSWTSGFDPENDDFGRFPYGQPPNKNGDYAFLLHMLASLKSTGKAAVILPHGVLFRGNAEGVIRRALVTRGFIKAVIGLPANLFYGTSIPASIIVLDKEGAADRQGILMIDASRGYLKDGNKNRLREQDVHRIVDTFTRGLDAPGYARFVPIDEVAGNAHNLNLPRYLESGESEDQLDIGALLHGGVPERDIDALGPFWEVAPDLRDALFGPNERPGYRSLRVSPDEVGGAVTSDASFAGFDAAARAVINDWLANCRRRLLDLNQGAKPKVLVGELSERLLDAMRPVRLVDPYRFYQRFVDFANEALRDDVYLISEAGWVAATAPKQVGDSKDANDFVVGKSRFRSDLLPSPLLVNRYFAEQSAALRVLDDEREQLEQTLFELAAEHGEYGGLLDEVVDDGGKFMRKAISSRLKDMVDPERDVDERQLLAEAARLMDRYAAVKGEVKDARGALDAAMARKYGELTEDEIKNIVVDDKWLATIGSYLSRELGRISSDLADRVAVLSARYERPLPELEERVRLAGERVAAHLRTVSL